MGLKIIDFVPIFEAEFAIYSYTIKIQRGHKIQQICTPQVIDKEFVYSGLLVAYWYYDPEKHMLVIFI